MFHLLSHRAVEGVVAVLFLIGAVLAFRESTKAEEELVEHEVATHGKTATTAFLIIFIAEWGELTQILTANLAAHYRLALSVGVGATLVLWAVAGIAVVGGQALLRVLKVSTLRRITGVVLVVLAVVAGGAVFPMMGLNLTHSPLRHHTRQSWLYQGRRVDLGWRRGGWDRFEQRSVAATCRPS